jgi:hypothetical protein
VLRAAVARYHAAARAAGLDWPDELEMPAGPPPEQVYRIFGVDHVAEQLTWLYAQPWRELQVLPDGGWLEPWPPGVDALDSLHMSVGTPFPWRQQLPLFHFDNLIHTFVLAGEHEGEIWRFEFGPDGSKPVRAAVSLAPLFDQWTRGVSEGVLIHDEGGWLRIEEDEAPLTTGLDPVAFPIGLEEDLLRQRQRECGVDLAAVDAGFERYEQMIRAVDDVKASLR